MRVATPQGRKVVAAFVERDGEWVLEKVVDAGKHMLKYPCEAWGVDVGALLEALQRGVQRVVIYDRRVGTWWARLDDFDEHGVRLNRGWGVQMALALSWWSFIPIGSVTAQRSLFMEVGK